MKKKTFLFFPVEIGLAHIVRPLAVAEELYSRKHNVLFALPKRKQSLFTSSSVQFVDIQSYIDNDSMIQIKNFTKYDFQRNLIQEECKLIKKYKPDTLIIDFRVSAIAAGLITKTPIFFLGLGEAMPYGCQIPNPGIPALLYRFFLPLFQLVFNRALTFYLKEIMNVVKKHNINITWNNWFKNISWILSEPSFYLSPVKKDLKVAFVGPLSWDGFQFNTPNWFHQIRPNGKTIYLTFGGTGFDKQKLIDLSLLLVNNGFRVVVSSGTIADPSDFPTRHNLFVSKFLPGKKITNRVDLVICHGGYGTTIESIHNRTPVLIIPFNPDQIVHGLRMQELGIAKCLFSFTPSDLVAIVLLQWSLIENKGKKLDIKIIVKNVQDMLQNVEYYKNNLAFFNKKYPYKNGAKQAADIIEKNDINPFEPQ